MKGKRSDFRTSPARSKFELEHFGEPRWLVEGRVDEERTGSGAPHPLLTPLSAKSPMDAGRAYSQQGEEAPKRTAYAALPHVHLRQMKRAIHYRNMTGNKISARLSIRVLAAASALALPDRPHVSAG